MMYKAKNITFVGQIIFSLMLVVGCGQVASIRPGNPIEAAPSAELTVSAAASLKDVMEEIKPLYQQENPQTEITYNFGSSGSLQRQIEQGAPVDIFISAATEKMDALQEQDLLLTETRRDLFKNQMVLIVPTNDTKVDTFTDLTYQQLATIALGEPESVPAGKYAQEVLTSLRIADKVNAKAVYGKDVRQVLNYVATENADAGIVYRTDAQVSDDVKIAVTAPEATHSPIVYPVAVLKDSDNPEAAEELIEFLTTPEAQAVFEQYGFTPIK